MLTGDQTVVERDVFSYIGQQGEAQEKITLIEPKWKLIINGPRITNTDIDDANRETLLFNIVEDPYEQTNLSGQHRDVVARMRRKLNEFRSLQPENAVPPYAKRDPDFKPPRDWRIPGT